MSTLTQIPPALTMTRNDLPWAHGVLAPGFSLQLLLADIENGLVVINGRFQPGTVIPTHRHTGPVHGFTQAGRWFYQEYGADSVNTAGSYIYEPAGSVHTLEAPADNTEVTEAAFVIYGALIMTDAQGDYLGTIDPTSTIELYMSKLKEQGDTRPEIILGGSVGIS